MAQTLRLRRGEMDDLDGLYALATIPRVYRYLFDGEPPSREYSCTAVSTARVGLANRLLWFMVPARWTAPLRWMCRAAALRNPANSRDHLAATSRFLGTRPGVAHGVERD